MPKQKILNATILDNIAKNLSKDQLEAIKHEVYQGYSDDDNSRKPFLDRLKRSSQIVFLDKNRVEANFDGDGSKIMLPVITTAAYQFASRASESFLPAKDILKSKPVTYEKENLMRADRTQKYLNYELDYKMDEYRDGLDTTFLKLPIDGTVLRKSFYDHIKKRKVVDWVPAQDFVINANTRYLWDSHRYTQIHRDYTVDDLHRLEEAGFFTNTKEIKTGNPNVILSENEENSKEIEGTEKPRSDDAVAERIVLEQHVMMDIEGNGELKKPYIIWMDYETKNILRISPRINPKTGERQDYFTKFGFLPNPNGFYDFGFSLFLDDMNEAMNKIINHVIDAGYLNNTKTFITTAGSGLKKGTIEIEMGKVNTLDARGLDPDKIFKELQFSPPSTVLYQMLEVLQNYTNRLTSVTDTTLGELPKSGTSATATAAAIEQGVKLFNAIYKRIHRSLKREYKKLFQLTDIYIDRDIDEYFRVAMNQDEVFRQANELFEQRVLEAQNTGQTIDPNLTPQIEYEQLSEQYKQLMLNDFASDIDVQPVSDINVISRQEKVAKAQLFYETVLNNPVTGQDPQKILLAGKNLMNAMEIDPQLVDDVFTPPKPQPPQDLPQEQENALILQGGVPNVLEQQDHEAHIKIMKEFQRSEFYQEMNQQQLDVFLQHYRTHQSYLYLQDTEILNSVT